MPCIFCEVLFENLLEWVWKHQQQRTLVLLCSHMALMQKKWLLLLAQ